MTLGIQKLIFSIMKQLLFDKIPKRKTFFGGSLLKRSHAKSARFLSTKSPIHLVLKSSKAKRNLSFLTLENQRTVKQVLKRTAYTFKIQILEFSNNGNHLHLLIRGYNRDQIKNFMRTLSALLSRYIQKKHKGHLILTNQTSKNTNPNTSSHKNRSPNAQGTIADTCSFWDQRPFTRIVESHKGYFVAKDYVVLNHLEALGIIPYQPRRTRYSSA